jgi:class 3 adenylate cyclase
VAATELPVSPAHGRATSTAYVSPLILQALSSDPDRALPWIEEVEGTLVMVDISGFTRLSERLAASGKEGSEILTDIINWYFQQMLDIARGYQGFNLKFGGDALLLFFQDSGHEKRAVQTAIEMQRANRGFAAIRAGNDKVRLRMSIGVHSGRFWSCAVGDPARRLQHVIFGDDVNSVAMAEAEAGAGEVLVSKETLAGIDVPTITPGSGDRRPTTLAVLASSSAVCRREQPA